MPHGSRAGLVGAQGRLGTSCRPLAGFYAAWCLLCALFGLTRGAVAIVRFSATKFVRFSTTDPLEEGIAQHMYILLQSPAQGLSYELSFVG